MKDLITEARKLSAIDIEEQPIKAEVIIDELCDALEKAEREKGCEWCKVGQNNARTVWIDGSFDAFTGDSYGEGASRKGIIDRKVAYCPMCGKRLEGEP